MAGKKTRIFLIILTRGQIQWTHTKSKHYVHWQTSGQVGTKGEGQGGGKTATEPTSSPCSPTTHRPPQNHTKRSTGKTGRITRSLSFLVKRWSHRYTSSKAIDANQKFIGQPFTIWGWKAVKLNLDEEKKEIQTKIQTKRYLTVSRKFKRPEKPIASRQLNWVQIDGGVFFTTFAFFPRWVPRLCILLKRTQVLD